MTTYISDSDDESDVVAIVDSKHPVSILGEQQDRLRKELAELDRQIATLGRKKRAIVKSIEAVQVKIDESALLQQTQRNERLKLGYESSSFAWSARISGLRQKVFNIASFRDNQEAIINATLDGRDVIVIMPTGGGKSLCYQLPALVSTGLTLVVSPLIALMDDQVMQLKELGIDAEAFTSESPNPAEIKAKLKQMCPITKRRRTNDPALDGDCKAIDLNAIPSGLRLLYASPEKIVTGKQFLALIEKIHSAGKLARIVIDECHCASEYGNDFRPDYSKLGILKYMFPEVPVIALSATCPPRVLDSVRKILGIQGGSGRPSAIVYTSPLWRQNLRYGVVRKTACLADQRMQLVEWITERHANDRGIVYCATKNNAYEVATQLYENDVKSYTVGLYYGNLEREKKEKLHEMWRNGQVQIIVATNAFGMGINSLDVRFVAHFTAPKTLENYYQESGRAGRDGAPADCVLFYRPTDSSKLVGWGFDAQAVDGLKKARAMVDYVECRHVCRKILLQEYLQGSPDALPPVQQSDPAQACGVCDICIKRPQVVKVDCTASAITVINIIGAGGEERMTLDKLCKYFRGCGLDKAPKIAALAKQNKAQFVRVAMHDAGYIINRFVAMGFLSETFGHSGYTTNAYLDIADRYRYIAGRTLDQTDALGPVTVEFTDDALPKGLNFFGISEVTQQSIGYDDNSNEDDDDFEED